MRITTGKYKGRKLHHPKGDKIRPTTSKTKEALFSILAFEIEGSLFLDLFSGAQSISFEALSRGANKVVSVDNSLEAQECFVKNINIFQDENINFFKRDALNFVKSSSDKFDIVFIDPPYEIDKSYLQEVLNNINASLIILETSIRDVLEIDNFTLYKEKRYGKTNLYFYKEN